MPPDQVQQEQMPDQQQQPVQQQPMQPQQVVQPPVAQVQEVPAQAAVPTPIYVAVVAGRDVRITGDMATATDGIAAASGAKIASAKHNVALRLTRGGSIALCQHSLLGLDARGSQLFMALQAGTMEASYPLSSGADNLLTSDYRVSVISGSGMPGQRADYRVGMDKSGDLLIQVMEASQSYLIVSSNFDNSQSVVRPGEIRGFPALGSNSTPEQISQSVALRCPFEKPPNAQTQTMMASNSPAEEKVPANSLQVPLAYRPPELPPETPKTPPPAPVAPAPVTQVAPAKAAAPPPSTVVQDEEPETPSPPPQPVKSKGRGNAFTRFFRRIFGGKG